MQNKHGGSIRSGHCHLKRCVKNTLTLYSFYVIKSRVSRNFYRNIHKPSTPEKEVNRKENTVGKIAKRLQIRKYVYACLDTNLNEVLSHYVMFCDKENRVLSSKIYRVSFVGIPNANYHSRAPPFVEP